MNSGATKRRIKISFKILLATVIALVIGGVVWLCASLGYCPVIGRLIAESKLSSYAGHQVEARFDWYNVCAYYDVTSYYRLCYYLKDDTIYSLLESNTISGDAMENYSAFLKQNDFEGVEFPEDIVVQSKLDGSDTTKSYSKVTVNSVRESVPLDRQASKERMCELAERILSSLDVNCTSIYFYYSNQGGDYMIRHDFGKHTIEPGELLQYAEEYRPL